MDEKISAESREADFIILMKGICDTDYILPKLRNLGFFSAPASTKYHGAYSGGLFDHSLAVMNELVSLTDSLGIPWQRKASPYIIGMFHDVCKCDLYKRKLDGTWEYRKDTLYGGHGEKSVMLLSTMMQLTEEEVACIRYHMGAFSDNAEERSAYSRACKYYPQVLYTHTADMIASQVRGI